MVAEDRAMGAGSACGVWSIESAVDGRRDGGDSGLPTGAADLRNDDDDWVCVERWPNGVEPTSVRGGRVLYGQRGKREDRDDGHTGMGEGV